jgi:hypothetical protein
MRTIILKRVWRAFGQVHFVAQSREAILMAALLLAATNLFAMPTVSLLSGGPHPATGVPSAGFVDGNIADAEYNTPSGLALDITGNYLFVADCSNNAIRVLDFSIDPNWTYTLLTLSTDGLSLTPNLFNRPVGVAIDSSDNLFVLNRGNGTNGSVLEFAIDETYLPFATLVATNAAHLTNAAGIALDLNDNIYVTIQSNRLLRISPNIYYVTNVIIVTNITPYVTNTYVTMFTTPVTNQTIVTANFPAGTSLQGIVVKHNGLIAACDSGRNGIYLINPTNGVVSTNAGFNGAGDFISTVNRDPIAIARFFQPAGVAETGDGSLIVTDFGNNRVKRVTSTGVTNLYGIRSNYWYGPYPGLTLGSGAVLLHDADTNNVQSRTPFGLAFAPDGSVYVTEKYWSVIRKVTGAGLVPLPLPPPPTPMNLAATPGYGQISLTWDPSPSATSYNVKHALSSGGPYTTIASTANTSCNDSNVIDGVTNYYVVSALNIGGESANSAEVSAIPWFSPPPTILLPITNYNFGPVILTWTTSPGATGYNVKRSTSTGTETTIATNTPSTTYSDGTTLPGTTYFYVVSALNGGGEGTNSLEASYTPPIPPPPPPVIGWYDFEGNDLYGFFSVLHAVSGINYYTANNDLYIAISPTTNGVNTYYIVTNGPQPVLAVPSSTNGITPPAYQDGKAPGQVTPLFYWPLSPATMPGMPDSVIKAVNVGPGGSSQIVTAEFRFRAGNPTIIGNNAAQFTISDVTSNVTVWYTLDGSDPTNGVSVAWNIVFVSTNGTYFATNYFPLETFSKVGTNYLIITTNGSSITTNYFPIDTTSLPAAVLITNGLTSIGPIAITNGLPVTLSLSMAAGSNILFQARAFRNGYHPSGIASQTFTMANYMPNTISFGFASGEASSDFVASPGQTFYAPVTLLPLPSTMMYSLQFNLTVTNGGPNPGPALNPGEYNFESLLVKPIPGADGLYEVIPPYMYITNWANPPPPSQILTYDGQPAFVSLIITNAANNLIGVGWMERFSKTNLYNTRSQDLIAYSMAHDDLFAQGGGKVILGGFNFFVPTNAGPDQTYQIRIGRPTATSDGIGAPGSSVFIIAPTNGSLGGGAINSIKNVTMGQRKYIVGNVYPFGWFNAGDFGNTNLQSADVEQVYQSAIYGLNSPATQAPGSDFFDAMDSCGATYVDLGHGYLEFNTLVSGAGVFDGNDETINQIAFGDGQLDVCDVYVTYRRSVDPSLTWFHRFWTNGVRVAETTPNVFNSGAASKASRNVRTTATKPGNISVTNQPKVIFTAGDFLAKAGQTLQAPITANIFGNYPLRLLMLNLTVVPIDGSPALTTPVSFSYNPALGTPRMTDQQGNGNYSAVWLDSGISGLSNNVSIGTLNVTIPTNATSSSAYAVHFDHASASPNGIASFPKQKLTGLITLSSRTNSSWGDAIPDSWRLRHFLTLDNLLSATNADADGDGVNNLREYQAGTDPTDPTSFFKNIGTDPGAAQQLQDCVISWPSAINKQYVIQRSPSLSTPIWTSIGTNSGNGTIMEFHDTKGVGVRFYRVSVQ